MRRTPQSCPAFDRVERQDGEDRDSQWLVVGSSSNSPGRPDVPMRRANSHEFGRKWTRRLSRTGQISRSLSTLLPKRRLSFVDLVLAGQSLELPENAIAASAEDKAFAHRQDSQEILDWEDQGDDHEDWVPADDELSGDEQVSRVKWTDGAIVQPKTPREKEDKIVIKPNTKLQITIRIFLRSAIYTAYELIGWKQDKDRARYVKLFSEWAVDEVLPPGYFSFKRKLCEYIVPAIISVFVMRRVKRLDYQRTGKVPRKIPPLYFVVAYRACRLLVMYRLFAPVGSFFYSVSTAIGLFACFFRQEGFKDLFYILRWPRYFAISQGLYGLLRSIMFAVAFSLPYSKLPSLSLWYRRRNVCKLVFFSIFIFGGRFVRFARTLPSASQHARLAFKMSTAGAAQSLKPYQRVLAL